MKRFFFILLIASFLISPTVHGFRDVDASSKIYPHIQKLIDQKVLTDGTFFRPQDPVPAQMFFEVVLKDAGFNPKSATFNTPLPPNIRETDPMAQFLREAIRRAFIKSDEEFDPTRPISHEEGLRILLKTKGILVFREASNVFLEKFPFIKKDDFAPYLEAGLASGLLEEVDIKNIKRNAPIIRKDLVRWLSLYKDRGSKKASLNPRGRKTEYKEKRVPAEKIPVEIEDKDGKTKVIEIEILQNNDSKIPLPFPNANIFQDIYETIINKYRFEEKITPELKTKMIDSAITGMVNALGDKFSSYMEPEKAKEFKEGIEGKFEGIGAYVDMIEEKFTITAPITNSPAQRAGILAGDIVTHVNGEPVLGKTTQQIVSLIKGPEGTEVKLTIMRGTEVKEFTIKREKILVPSISVKVEKGIPIISIHKFAPETKQEFKKVIEEEVIKKNPRGVVFDLRNDPGGFLNSAIDLGEFLVDKNTLLFSIEYKNGSQEFRSTRKGELFGQKNIVVLQNKGTASASEIFTAMVQDYKIGKVIGTKSFGKGTVQEVLNYRNKGILKLTVAKWLSPLGRWIQEDPKNEGVIPDIEVSDPTPEEIKNKIDRQLDRAIQYILTGN